MNAVSALRRLKLPDGVVSIPWREGSSAALAALQSLFCGQAFCAGALSSAVHAVLFVVIASWMFHGETVYVPPTALVAQFEVTELQPAQPEMIVALHTTSTSAAGSERTELAMHVNGTGGKIGIGEDSPTLDIGVVGTSGGAGQGGHEGVSLSGNAMLKEVGEIKTEATFFGVKAGGRKFAFVVDTSGSMGQEDRWLRARLELERSLLALGYGQEYYVAFFNHTAFPMPAGKLTPARPVNIRQTLNWIHRAVPAGGTEPWPALTMAMAQKPDAVFLLTDGIFDTAVSDNLKLLSTGKRIPIYTIGFAINNAPPDIAHQIEEQLSFIARMTGGTYRSVP